MRYRTLSSPTAGQPQQVANRTCLQGKKPNQYCQVILQKQARKYEKQAKNS